MFKTLSYKKRNKLLLIAASFLAVVVYFLAIKKSIVVIKQYRALKEQLQIASDAPQKAAELQKKLAELDHVLEQQQQTTTSVQETLLGFITNYCQNNNLILREFPKTIHVNEKDFLIETNVFTVEGGFLKILPMIYLLEQKNKIGKIASVNFQTKKDFKTKNTALTATVYLQNVSKKTKGEGRGTGDEGRSKAE